MAVAFTNNTKGGTLERVIWMMDETIADSHPDNWDTITHLYKELLSAIGKEEMEHVILDPRPCLRRIADQIHQKEYTAVIDLTGWLGSFVEALFPSAQIIDCFGMTRVRDVSSPMLKTTGHLLKSSPEELHEMKNQIDKQSVLIIDDVSFSGGTGLNTADIFGINQPDHAYAIANTGLLGSSPGAVERIEEAGHSLVWGFEIHTPRDDGWHLKDLHQFPNLEESFRKSIVLQELMLLHGPESDEVKDFLTDPKTVETLFPTRFTAQEVIQLHTEGKFLYSKLYSKEAPPPEGTIHVPNPLLWTSQYLMDHIDREKLIARREDVLSILIELKGLTPGYHAVKPSVDLELRRLAEEVDR